MLLVLPTQLHTSEKNETKVYNRFLSKSWKVKYLLTFIDFFFFLSKRDIVLAAYYREPQFELNMVWPIIVLKKKAVCIIAYLKKSLSDRS